MIYVFCAARSLCDIFTISAAAYSLVTALAGVHGGHDCRAKAEYRFRRDQMGRRQEHYCHKMRLSALKETLNEALKELLKGDAMLKETLKGERKIKGEVKGDERRW